METTTRLTFEQGSSSKEYTVSITRSGDKFLVNFSYGRIGSALKSGTKTPQPVSLEDAKRIAAKLVNEKTRKGYQECSESTPPSAHCIDVASVDPLFIPQLSNAIESESLLSKILLEGCSPCFAQIKKDGERRPVLVTEMGEVFAMNRRGLPAAIRSDVKSALLTLADDRRMLLDCEDMGEEGLFIFDVLELSGYSPCSDPCQPVDEFNLWRHETQHTILLPEPHNDLTRQPFFERARVLEALAKQNESELLMFAETWCLEDIPNAEALIEQSRSTGEEGLIIRTAHSYYSPGHPASGGTVLKLKHWNDISCVVDGANESRRSVRLVLRDPDSGSWRFVGSVTIPPRAQIPAPGKVIDVRYLYCSGPNGSLIQPVFLRDRSHEIASAECTTSKLVMKGEGAPNQQVAA